MQKEMIVTSNGHETQVAILEEDLVTEMFVERERQRGVVGNIYKGRVSKVLPGMQCAFIDIGLDRDGFLYVSDVVDTIEEFDKLDAEDDDKEEPAAGGASASSSGSGGGGRGERGGRGRERGPQPKIEELLKEGQEIVVQVAKEPLGTKGARLTSHATLAGRFLVFMPTVDHVGVSRKIESREERNRLRGIVRTFREDHGFGGGVIIRTAAGWPSRGRYPRATSNTSTTSGRRRATNSRRRARRRSSTASRASSRSCCATCSPRTSRRSASTTRRNTST